MPYVITNGTEYITKNYAGKFVTIRNPALADEFKKQTAEKILKNSLSKRLRKGMYLEKVECESNNDLQEIDTHCNDVEFEVPQNIQDWIDKLQELNGLVNEAETRRKDLVSKLKDVEGRQQDILHYIEFCSLNACQGYKAYKQLKDIRQERRKIKNELEVIEFILDKKMTDTVSQEATNLINNIKNRQYEPRVLQQLFDV